MDTTAKEAHQVQREQTRKLDEAIKSLQTNLDTRHDRLQSSIESKLSTIGEQTRQKLADVESRCVTKLSSFAAQQLRDETRASSASSSLPPGHYRHSPEFRCEGEDARVKRPVPPA
ncbi:MAG: hypothetical protein IRZ15_07570 [Bryobacteraceae bacterium]|nr:hypothetical protein [Bryobacteraceae bacterium]